MSCHLIAPDTAIICATWALKQHASIAAPALHLVTEAATEIWRTNVGAIVGRYPGKSDAIHATRYPEMIWWNPNELAEFTDGHLTHALELDPREAHMNAREANYQACDLDDYEQTRGGKLIAEAMDRTAYEAGSRFCTRGWPSTELVDTDRTILNMEARAI